MDFHNIHYLTLGVSVIIALSGMISPPANAQEVIFPDPNLEQAVRDQINVPTGPIYDWQLSSEYALNARSYGITDLTGIEQWPVLMAADFGENTIANLSPLAAVDSLFVLLLDNNQLSDVSTLAGLTSLKLLDLRDNQIVSVAPLSGLTALNALLLGGNSLADVTPLVSLTNLRDPSFAQSEFDLSADVGLDLSDNQISDVSPLASLVNLTSLDISGNQIADVSALSVLESLTWLDAGENQIANAEPLSSLTGLEVLDLGGNRLTALPSLSSMTALTVFDAANNQIADAGPLNGLTSLQTLILTGNNVVDPAPLASLANARTVMLDDNRIVDLSSLADSASFAPSGLLDVSGNPLSAASLCDALGALHARLARVFPDAVCNEPHMTRIRTNSHPGRGIPWPGGFLATLPAGAWLDTGPVGPWGISFQYANEVLKCLGGAEFGEVMTAVDRSCTAIGEMDGALYAYSAMTWESSGNHTHGILHPSALYTSANGENWTQVPFGGNNAFGLIPRGLWGHDGNLYLQCYDLDVYEFLSQIVGPIPPGTDITMDGAFLVGMQDFGRLEMGLLLHSTDGGTTWTELAGLPWDDSQVIVQNAALGGRHFVRTALDPNNSQGSRCRAFYTDNGTAWAAVDIVPDTNEQVAGLGVSGGQLFALASGSDVVDDTPPNFMDGFGHLDGGPTVWKTPDGVAWTPVSDEVPLPAELLASDDILLAFPTEFSTTTWSHEALGIYYSPDGAHWFNWNHWPTDFDPTRGPLSPLAIHDNALYCSASLFMDESPFFTVPEIWRIPLSEFSAAGPPRVTISRADGQPPETDGFPVLFDIVWSESVNGFDVYDVFLDDFLYSLSGPTNLPGGLVHYTLTVTGYVSGNKTFPEAPRDIAPYISAGSATDGDSNANEASAGATGVVYFTGQVPSYTPAAGLPALCGTAMLLGLGGVSAIWKVRRRKQPFRA